MSIGFNLFWLSSVLSIDCVDRIFSQCTIIRGNYLLNDVGKYSNTGMANPSGYHPMRDFQEKIICTERIEKIEIP